MRYHIRVPHRPRAPEGDGLQPGSLTNPSHIRDRHHGARAGRLAKKSSKEPEAKAPTPDLSGRPIDKTLLKGACFARIVPVIALVVAQQPEFFKVHRRQA
jgi:hypothetical protein